MSDNHQISLDSSLHLAKPNKSLDLLSLKAPIVSGLNFSMRQCQDERSCPERPLPGNIQVLEADQKDELSHRASEPEKLAQNQLLSRDSNPLEQDQEEEEKEKQADVHKNFASVSTKSLKQANADLVIVEEVKQEE